MTLARRLQHQPKMVLIDLDGTLVDSALDLAYCVDLMMAELAMPARGEQAVRQWIGNGVAVLVRRALTNSLTEEADPQLYQRAHDIFLALYEANVCVHSRPYEGVVEGLEFLQGAGLKLGCVTNKPARFTEPLLEKLGLSAYFGVIVSGDTLTKRKPDPAPLLYAAEKLQTSAADSMMVGDSVHDVEAGRAAGFQVACVTYGYNHGHDIRDAKPDIVIDSLAQLSEVLSG